jgi:hypothetical protein
MIMSVLLLSSTSSTLSGLAGIGGSDAGNLVTGGVDGSGVDGVTVDGTADTLCFVAFSSLGDGGVGSAVSRSNCTHMRRHRLVAGIGEARGERPLRTVGRHTLKVDP